MSVWVTLKMKVKQGLFDRLSDFLTANLPNVRGVDGTLKVNLFYDPDSQIFLLHEEWASKEHHQAYIKFIQERGVMQDLLAFMESEPEVTYYNRLMM